jgi:hypothetical protein
VVERLVREGERAQKHMKAYDRPKVYIDLMLSLFYYSAAWAKRGSQSTPFGLYTGVFSSSIHLSPCSLSSREERLRVKD